MSLLHHRENVEEEILHTSLCCRIGLDFGYLETSLKAVLSKEVLKLLGSSKVLSYVPKI